MIIGTSTNYPKSENNFCNQTTSHVVIVGPIYSTYVLDSAIVVCFLLLQLTSPLPKRKHETIG
jgi:hypothetical protein